MKVPEHKRRHRHARNPFPDIYFFPVPLDFFEKGLVASMSGSEVKRYLTLLRLANYHYGRREIRKSLRELKDLDGLSERRAFHVNAKLLEHGLVDIKNTSPITYVLRHPDSWSIPWPRKKPGSGRAAEASTEIMPPTYQEVFGR